METFLFLLTYLNTATNQVGSTPHLVKAATEADAKVLAESYGVSIQNSVDLTQFLFATISPTIA